MSKAENYQNNIFSNEFLGDWEKTHNHLIEHWCKKILTDIHQTTQIKGYNDKSHLTISLSLIENVSLCTETTKEEFIYFFHPRFIPIAQREIVITSGFYKNKKRICQEYALALTDLAKYALLTLQKSAAFQGIVLEQISFLGEKPEIQKPLSLDTSFAFSQSITFDVGEDCLMSKEWGIICDFPLEQQKIFHAMQIEYVFTKEDRWHFKK